MHRGILRQRDAYAPIYPRSLRPRECDVSGYVSVRAYGDRYGRLRVPACARRSIGAWVYVQVILGVAVVGGVRVVSASRLLGKCTLDLRMMLTLCIPPWTRAGDVPLSSRGAYQEWSPRKLCGASTP